MPDVGRGDEDGGLLLVLPGWEMHDGAILPLDVQGYWHEVGGGNLGNLHDLFVVVGQVCGSFLSILCFYH